MTWRERIDEALRSENARNTRDTRDTRGESPPSVPFVPSVPANPARLLKFWHGKLQSLDPLTVPEGWGPADWSRLCDDCWWLYENFASVAVSQGWGASGLFGVWSGNTDGGGLAQILEGSRNLVLVDGTAHLTAWGITSKHNAAIGHGLPLVWEIGQ